jgi:hypothetical protein
MTEYKCKYCGNKMNEFEFNTYKGYCGKCREILDWKQILNDFKNLKK